MTYTVKEVAEILNCSTNHVRGLCKAGKIQAVDMSKKKGERSFWRIPETGLTEFLSPKTPEPIKPVTGSYKERWLAMRASNRIHQ